MKAIKFTPRWPSVLLAVHLLLASFIGKAGAANHPGDLLLVGSTPGDALITSALSIPAQTKVDFIKWQLTLENFREGQYQFLLQIHFGESQPNTLGFVRDGERKSIKGTCKVTAARGLLPGDVYELKSSQLSSPVSMVRLDDHLFHLLTPEKKLMVGNGGWSYSLNKKTITRSIDAYKLPSTLISSKDGDTTSSIIFDGRTPCKEFAADHSMKVDPSCFKLKWRLVLNKHPVTHEPTTYTIRKVVDNVPRDVSGKWKMIKGIQGNPQAIIYQLDPDDPQRSISLLAGDDNVLFFLTKDHQLYVGNEDFSFALNKRPVKP